MQRVAPAGVGGQLGQLFCLFSAITPKLIGDRELCADIMLVALAVSLSQAVEPGALGPRVVSSMNREAMLREKTRRLRLGRGEKMRSTSPADRVPMNLTRAYLDALGWTWTPTMQVGSGCRVHLRADELPAGRLIARCSGHLVAVVDGVIRDTYDPTRGGTRCVYGYWSEGAATGRSS